MWRQEAQITVPNQQVTFFSNVHNTLTRGPHRRNRHIWAWFIPYTSPQVTNCSHLCAKNEGHKPALINKLLFDIFNVKWFPYHSTASMKHILHRDSRSSSPDGHSRPPQHPLTTCVQILWEGKDRCYTKTSM